MTSLVRRRIMNWSRHADETTIFFAVTKLQSLFRRNKAADVVQRTFGWTNMRKAQYLLKKNLMGKRMKQDKLVKRLKAANEARDIAAESRRMSLPSVASPPVNK